MAHSTTRVNGSVILVEPNIMNGNENQTNTVPQYQDMYIFAELKATRKGRTVIINNKVSDEFTDFGTVNFIGVNQDDSAENPNYLNFTTNYYDGSVGNKTQYEGFGITNIKMQTNSSYIPKVNIQFVDIRGLAFFNQEDSPYRMLFDFPPPIFQLTVKGYYGKPLTYRLHLVKYTSEFSSSNGNFTIDAEFVGVTFAPLTDVLFKYILNTPLIELGGNMSSETGEPPQTTYELILKLQSVYAKIGKMLKSDAETIELREIENDLVKIDIVDGLIQGYKENEALVNAGTPYLARRTPQKPINFVEPVKTDNRENDYFVEIRDIREFNSEIAKQQSSNDSNTKTERLFIAYAVSSNLKPAPEIPPFPEPLTASTSILDDIWEFPSANQAAYFYALNKYRERLLGENLSSIEITEADIKSPEDFILNSNLKTQEETRTKYYGMELTDFYYGIYKQKGKLLKRKEELAQDVADKINAALMLELGMLPSVYNVMEIILNDVDKFFEILKKTAVNAHHSHNEDENKSRILNDSTYGEKSNTSTIYPFPLIIEGNDNSKQRVAPIELSKIIEFPELSLVDNFINTFLLQEKWEEQYNLRNNQGDDGLNYWIPIAPIDSVLGGSSPTSPYFGLSNNVRNDILKILLQRYYIFSQGVLPYTIYPSFTDGKKEKLDEISKAYVKMYGIAEAININETLISKKIADAVDVMCGRYINNIQNFYDDIENLTVTYETSTGDRVGSLYSFTRYQPISFPITPSDIGTARIYTDKNNPDFVGLNITDEPIAINSDDDKDNKLNEFLKKSNIAGSRAAIRRGTYDFTTDNIPYLPDTYNDKDFFGSRNEKKGLATINLREGGDTGLYTRFLNEYSYYGIYGGTTYKSTGFDVWDGIDFYYPNSMNIAYNEGHSSFSGTDSSNIKGTSVFSMGNNIIDIWTQTLAEDDNDEKLYHYLTNNNRLSSVLFLSNFGNTLSPFVRFPNNINNNFFATPSIIGAPAYVGAYVGALLKAIEEDWEDDILDFFTGTSVSQGIKLPNKGYYVLADLHDVREYLSENDKRVFIDEYRKFMENFDTFQEDFKKLYNLTNNVAIRDVKTKDKRYKYFLDPNVDTEKDFNAWGEKGQFSNLMSRLIYRKSIVIHTEKTFKRVPLTDFSPGYVSLFEINNNIDYGDSYYKPTTDLYFQTLFSRLSSSIGETKNELRQEDIKAKKIRGDKDIINQMYYSFKNINDKWLSGTGEAKRNYPLISGNNTKLIDRFAFVDRAMNPIGETMINAEMLIDLVNDDSASVFTVISSLLSANGFVFFPLQNFLSFENDKSWEDSFKIQTGSISDQEETYFVAMYIGGTSSYPSIKTNGFEEDGIISLDAPSLPVFSSSADTQQYNENQNQVKAKEDFPWGQVRAFRVRFGEQNQSMFEDIKIDSKEYNDTNESIQILSRLAGDNKESQPTPKGQNLYNMYENRSYKASISGFGNAMIQPTQYFQLENIPMFNGAYIILDVEHNISPNKMRTTFSGTKILKYPVPRVMDSIASREFSDISAGEAARRAAESENTPAPQATMMTPERLEQLNSVYGIDVSHWNGNIDWNLMKKNSVPIDFTYMKITQGSSIDSFNYNKYDFTKNIREAKANGIKIGVYHFAEFGRTSNPVNDANADADNCLDNIALMPSPPDLPIVLDIEDDGFRNNYLWSNKKDDIKTYIDTWIRRIEDAGYEVMIYSGVFLTNYEIDYLFDYPLWFARYYTLTGNANPEKDSPSTPIRTWNDWTIWQFSSQGNVTGVNGGVDINAMRKSFFNKY